MWAVKECEACAFALMLLFVVSSGAEVACVFFVFCVCGKGGGGVFVAPSVARRLFHCATDSVNGCDVRPPPTCPPPPHCPGSIQQVNSILDTVEFFILGRPTFQLISFFRYSYGSCFRGRPQQVSFPCGRWEQEVWSSEPHHPHSRASRQQQKVMRPILLLVPTTFVMGALPPICV